MQEGISASRVWRILITSYCTHTISNVFKVSRTQDFLPRLTFCQQIQQQSALDRQFLNNILFTDEAGFNRDVVSNFHSCHVWAAVNPNEMNEARYQQSISFNVWVGILGDCLIGPHFLPHRLNVWVGILGDCLIRPHFLPQVKRRAVPAFSAA